MGNTLLLCRHAGNGREVYTTTVIRDPSSVYQDVEKHPRGFNEEDDDEDESEEEAEHSMYEIPRVQQPNRQHQLHQLQGRGERKSPLAILTNPLYDDMGDEDVEESINTAIDEAKAAAAAQAALEKVRSEAAGKRSFLLEQNHPETKQPDPVLL